MKGDSQQARKEALVALLATKLAMADLADEKTRKELAEEILEVADNEGYRWLGFGFLLGATTASVFCILAFAAGCFIRWLALN